METLTKRCETDPRLKKPGWGICPECKGFGTKPDPHGWEQECGNCGGQKQFGRGSGVVPINRMGQPCKHDYPPEGEEIGRCLRRWVCTLCSDSFTIDSGD